MQFNKIYFFLIILFFILFKNTYSQNNAGEFSFLDCNKAKLITIPFNKNAKREITKNILLNQTTFYNVNEQISYSYLIYVLENTTLYLQTNANNVNDSYDMEVYNASKLNFCSNLKLGKAKPLNNKINLNKKKHTFILNVISGSTYYINVTNTSVGNCGHTLKIKYLQSDTLNINAIHIPCERKFKSINVLNTLTIKEKENKIDLNRTINYRIEIANNVSFNKVEIALIDDLTKLKINVNPFITNELTGDTVSTSLLANGNIEAAILNNNKYNIQFNVIGYKPINQSLTVLNNNATIALTRLSKGDKFTLKNIYFYANTYALKEESENQLSNLLLYLTNNPDKKIRIIGHTNGNSYINKNDALKIYGNAWTFEGSTKQLSKKRAESIKQYLNANKINIARIQTKGVGGDQMLIKTPENIEEAKKNMRVEIEFL